MNDESPHPPGGTDVQQQPAPDPTSGDPGPEGTRDERGYGQEPRGIDTENLRNYRSLRRSATDRKLAGVCGGLARHLDIDPTLVRVVIVVLAIFGGAGVLLYAVLWLFVPREGANRAVISLAESARNAVIIVTLLLALLIALPAGFDGFAVPLLVIAIVAIAILMSKDSDGTGAPPASDAGPTHATPAAASPSRGGVGTSPAPAYPQAAGRPRRGGPLLFGIALASITLGLGILGLVDAGGSDIPDAAYPALALAVVGAWLLVGSVYGRSGGLILLGLASLVALCIAQVAEPTFRGDREVVERPASAAALDSSYRVPAGRIEIDLTGVADVDDLDGRRLEIDANAGHVLLVVPDDLEVDLDADVGAGGRIETPDESREGWGVSLRQTVNDDDPSARLEADLGVGFGLIEVRSQR